MKKTFAKTMAISASVMMLAASLAGCGSSAAPAEQPAASPMGRIDIDRRHGGKRRLGSRRGTVGVFGHVDRGTGAADHGG